MITIIVLAGYAALPKEPYESSIVDGANIFQRFWFITLPLLRPTIVVAAMFRLIDLMKTFDLVYVISGGGPGNSSELLYLYIYQQTFNFYHMGYGSAAVLVLFISILIGIILLGLVRRARETE
jgi:multiple sugar transport system permease protein